MALKGTTRIELTNVITKEVEVIEKTNLVTNAVSDVLTMNPYGYRFRKEDVRIEGQTTSFQAAFMPLCPNLFGGILLYENQLEENAEKYYADMNNPIIGYSSNNVSPADDPRRGSMNQSESGPLEDGTGYRFVFDFATSQANGLISALGLTSRMGGTGGHGSKQDTYKNNAVKVGFFMSSTETGTTKDPDIGQANIVSIDPEKGEALYAYVSGQNTIKLGKFRFPIDNIGLVFQYSNVLEKIPYSETAVYTQYFASVLDQYGVFYGTLIDGGDGYIYGLQHDGNAKGNSSGQAKIRWIKISKEDYSATEGTWTVDAQLLQFGEYYTGESSSLYYKGINHAIIDNGILYAIKYTSNQYMHGVYTIPLENTTDISLLKFNDGYGWVYSTENSSGYGMKRCTSVNKIGGVIVYRAGYISGGELHPRNSTLSGAQDTWGCLTDAGKPGISCGPYIFGITEEADNRGFLSVYIQSCYLATINNLPASVLKTADKTMKITYVLREDTTPEETEQ